jgi:transposase
MALSGGLHITSANQQTRRPKSMIAVGVDTHKEQHLAVALDGLGQLARFTSEAAFARANGTAAQPASSGKTVRHRLSRGGDRQINAAIYTIALSRSVHHADSRAYMQRRINEGKTKREAMRSLKRYLSRHLYNQLTKRP